MERYELLNKIAQPVDMLLGGSLELARKAGVYDKVRETLVAMIKQNMMNDFEKKFNLEILGTENVPASGGAIVAANHQSWLDAQVLGASSERELHFMAKSEFVEWPVLSKLIDLTQSVFIRRGGDSEGLQDVVNRLKEGWLVAIFPEGTIPGEEEVSRDELEPETGLLRGKSGVVRLAIMAGVPIIPVGVSGTGQAFPPEMYPRLEMPPMQKSVPITIKYGKPIHFKEKDIQKVDREKLREYTSKVMKEISALIDHKRCFIPIELPIKKPDTSGLKYYPKKTGKSEYGVLALHGFTSAIDTVSGIEPFLKEKKIPYRFPILRGHGTIPHNLVGVTFQDWYDDAEKALLELYERAEKIIVVGLSMGGLVSIELGINHPDKVSNVVLIAAALKFADPMSVLSPALAKVFKFWDSPNSYNDEYMKEKNNRNYSFFATDSFASLLEASKEVEKRLPLFDRPVLILQSKKDTVVDPKAAKVIYSKIKSKDKKIAWFNESGHEMCLDLEADAVLKTIDDYISKVVG
ncbi:MAG TPA: alpha/beta fold hydrolase [bacterium]|nr:alpha/beta fold hydrolase [bacterium]